MAKLNHVIKVKVTNTEDLAETLAQAQSKMIYFEAAAKKAAAEFITARKAIEDFDKVISKLEKMEMSVEVSSIPTTWYLRTWNWITLLFKAY